jgi:hypothetical protein
MESVVSTQGIKCLHATLVPTDTQDCWGCQDVQICAGNPLHHGGRDGGGQDQLDHGGKQRY